MSDLIYSLIKGKPATDEGISEALYEVCDNTHASCNNNCPVYALQTTEEKAAMDCLCFKDGYAMLAFIREREGIALPDERKAGGEVTAAEVDALYASVVRETPPDTAVAMLSDVLENSQMWFRHCENLSHLTEESIVDNSMAFAKGWLIGEARAKREQNASLQAQNQGLVGALTDLLGDQIDIKNDSCLHCGRDYSEDKQVHIYCPSEDCPAHKARKALSGEINAQPDAQIRAIDMLLFCPKCGQQHVDEAKPDVCETCGGVRYDPEFHQDALICACEVFTEWLNPPHKSHRCNFCNHVWRPADIPTNGVAALQAKGERDGDPRPQIEGLVGALQNMVGAFDNPICRRVFHDDFTEEAVRSAKEALAPFQSPAPQEFCDLSETGFCQRCRSYSVLPNHCDNCGGDLTDVRCALPKGHKQEHEFDKGVRV